MQNIINPHAAARKGDSNILSIFLERGGDINIRDEDAFTPLHYATNFGHIECVKFLIQIGADVNARSRFGSVPLHFAAEHGRVDIIKILLTNDAQINSMNSDRATPLHFAVQRGFCKASVVLIEHGAQINVQTKKGNTPLHYASFFGHTRIVKELLNRGAEISVMNAASKLAGIDFLRKISEECRQEIRELLRDAHLADRIACNCPADAARSPVLSPNSIVGQDGPTIFSSAEELQKEVVRLNEVNKSLQLALQFKDSEVSRLANHVCSLEKLLRSLGVDLPPFS